MYHFSTFIAGKLHTPFQGTYGGLVNAIERHELIICAFSNEILVKMV